MNYLLRISSLIASIEEYKEAQLRNNIVLEAVIKAYKKEVLMAKNN
jgi:hypothetical protein